MGEILDRFRSERERLNELVLASDDLNLKRFFALDNAVYREGALSVKMKELLGLTASTVLRCNDCIRYHVDQCFEAGVTREELDEALGIALIVGGSITIPHLRQAVDLWTELEAVSGTKEGREA